MHTGTRQEERLAPALDPALSPAFVRPDELDLATRLRLTLELARQLRFVDGMSLQKGHWGEVLHQDLSLVLAEISCGADAAEVDRTMALWPRMAERLQWHCCFRLAKQLDAWCAQLEQHVDLPEASPHAQEPGLAARMLQQLQTFLDGELGPQLIQMHASYVLRGDNPLAHVRARIKANEIRASELDRTRTLRQLWLSLGRARAQLAVLAAELLPASLQLGNHDPAMGVLLAFGQLVQRSRAPLDDFTNRLIGYYYRDSLGFRPLQAGTDRVHLLLECDPRYARPVVVLKGTRFLGGKDSRGQPLCYCAEQELPLSTLKVERLVSLRLDRDVRVSPEREFAYATQAHALCLRPPTPEEAALPRAPAWPLLGGGQPGSDFHAARQGLALASPLLQLNEGEREIEIDLQLSHPGAHGALGPNKVTPPDGAWLRFLLNLCLASQKPAQLQQHLGHLFAVWITGREELATADLKTLRQHARRVLGEKADPAASVDNPLSLIYGDRGLERSLVFDRVFRGLWTAQLSTEKGWFTPGEVYTSRIESDEPAAAGRLRLHLKLSAAAPAIQSCSVTVHGTEWPELPVLRLQMTSQTRMFGCTLLQHLGLEWASLRVRASGLRQLVLYNQLGRLDASKPFLPFGPLPDRSAYLMFSNAELATKPLSALSLRLQWAGLPSDGLAAHYAAYGDGGTTVRDSTKGMRRWDESTFVARSAVLYAARWHVCDTPAPLFAKRGPSQLFQFDGDDLRRLHLPVVESPDPNAPALAYSLATRQGFFRLQLDGAESAFGHALYPRLLTERLTHNSRNKNLQKQLVLPAEPYTPRLEQISVSYSAQERITLRQDQTRPGAAYCTQFLQLSPFGLRPLQVSGADQSVHLLAPWACGAELHIGLSGAACAGRFSLLFQLQADAAAEALNRPRPVLRWAAWCGSQWLELPPHRLLTDSTQGMLRTGIMVLDLPAGMTADCPEMRGSETIPLLWLRLSAAGDLSRLAPIQGVWAHAVSAVRWREAPEDSQGEHLRPLPRESIRAAQPAIAGLANIRQPLASFDWHQPEREAQMRIRAAERLRHRDRAITPWDMERLVLQAFPEVQQLKCLPLGAQGQSRGSVLLVVVPAPLEGDTMDGTQAPRLNAAKLDAITAFLQQRGVAGLRLLVRNATYDRIQVRCKLKLQAGLQTGEYLRELHQAVRDYLSPWRPGGITARFDWMLRAEELEAHLRAQAGVASVGEVSLLQIVRHDKGRYRLNDSARSKGLNLITPSRPWSLALPTRQHLLEVSETVPLAAPRPTGLSRLALGSSFIIGGPRA